MQATQHHNPNRLTGFDRHLITRVAYAMVVAGLWGRVVARSCEDFDYYEIFDDDNHAHWRIGRCADGGYRLLDLRSGLQQRGRSLADVLGNVAYVPGPVDRGPIAPS